jgi:site-specific recombinase XerD
MLNTNHLSFIYSFLLSLAFLLLMHTARHTFATTVTLANDVALQNVSKMLGHSSTRMTQHYARVLDNSIMKDMQDVSRVFG